MIKVFIIDDSMLVRNSIKKVLKGSNEIEVIGEAPNPVDAFKEFTKIGLPDVFLLDIEMPKMNGIEFLEKLKNERPIPTIICSSIAEKGSSKALEALELGAIDIIQKPKIGSIDTDMFNEFISKIKAAYNSKVILEDHKIIHNNTPLADTNKVVAIGSSTGGVKVLETILENLQPNHAPILITQHMPAGFTHSFANRLNKNCKNSYVKEAEDGEEICSGKILIAPGDLHMEIKNIGIDKYEVVLKNYPKVSNHKPSVDVLFTSFSKEVKVNTIAFILTGMGKDGANGLKKIKDSGGMTYGQDEATSVVYGMPKVAYEIGAVEKQVALNDVAKIINSIT